MPCPFAPLLALIPAVPMLPYLLGKNFRKKDLNKYTDTQANGIETKLSAKDLNKLQEYQITFHADQGAVSINIDLASKQASELEFDYFYKSCPQIIKNKYSHFEATKDGEVCSKQKLPDFIMPVIDYLEANQLHHCKLVNSTLYVSCPKINPDNIEQDTIAQYISQYVSHMESIRSLFSGSLLKASSPEV